MRLDASYAAVRALLAFCYRPAVLVFREVDELETLLEMVELNNTLLGVRGAQAALDETVQAATRRRETSASASPSPSPSVPVAANPLLSSAAVAQEMNALSSTEFQQLADLAVVVDNQRFLAHRAIVAARCEYFRALLAGSFAESGQTEVTVSGVSAETFAIVMHYLYTGRLAVVAPDVTAAKSSISSARRADPTKLLALLMLKLLQLRQLDKNKSQLPLMNSHRSK